MTETEFQIQRAQAIDETLNPTRKHTARTRRILRDLRSRIIPSTFPVSSDEVIVDDENDIVEKRFSYRTEVIAKDPYEKLERKTRELPWTRLLRRRKQIARELRIAKGQLKANIEPKKVPGLQAKVVNAQWVSDAVEAAYTSRISGGETMKRLTNLTPRVLWHKLRRGNKVLYRANRRCVRVARCSWSDRHQQRIAIYQRNEMLTKALTEICQSKN